MSSSFSHKWCSLRYLSPPTFGPCSVYFQTHDADRDIHIFPPHLCVSFPSTSPNFGTSTMPTPSMPILLLSDRTATLVLTLLGACGNFYAAFKLVSMWFSFRWSWEAESEWEGSDAWRIDAARALGALVCAYFLVGGIACVVGLVGVCKRRLSHLRLFRDYSICDLVFDFSSTTLLALASTRPAVRAFLCEELSRQPDVLRSLSDNAGLNVENCESFFDKAVVGIVMVLYVLLFIRLQLVLTVLNYYAHLRRTQHHQPHLPLHGHGRRSSLHGQRVLLLPTTLRLSGAPPSPTSSSRTIVYAPVSLTAEQARAMDAREAYLSISQHPRHADRMDGTGVIALPTADGELPWASSRRSRDHSEKV